MDSTVNVVYVDGKCGIPDTRDIPNHRGEESRAIFQAANNSAISRFDFQTIQSCQSPKPSTQDTHLTMIMESWIDTAAQPSPHGHEVSS
jgi:hypothetical protein